MITIERLTVSYKKENPVLENLNLSLDDCKIHGIVGLNGSGKTTFLNTLFGLKKSDSGKIKLNNLEISRRDLSFLVTENYFYPNITGAEYLQLFKNESFDIDKWNQLFHLPLKKVIDDYSTGMKKKLAFLSILKQDKPIMILDEPFNGLDIETNRIIRSILLKFKEQRKTIIITSHIIETLTNVCDFIHYLEDGSIKFSKDKTQFAAFEKEIFENIESKNAGILNKLMD